VSAVYDHAIRMLTMLDEAGIDHEMCVHSKYTPGCPSCTQHWLRYHGIEVKRWNPDAVLGKYL